MQSQRGSQSTVVLPRIQGISGIDPQLYHEQSQEQSQHSTGNRENQQNQSNLLNSIEIPTSGHYRSSSMFKNGNQGDDIWKHKFKLLEVRAELKYASNSAKHTKSIMKSLSPSLTTKAALKDSISSWGRDSSVFKTSAVFFNDEEMKMHNARERERIEDEKQEKIIMKKMNESFENPIEDNQKKSCIGEEAPLNYFKHYKQLDKVTQQNKFFQIQDSTFTSVLQAAQKQMVIPCKIGLIKETGNEEDLFIKNMKYGDSYAKVLSEGMKRVPNVQNFYMSGNRITLKGADELLKAISKKARVLELSENLIGSIGCQHISLALSDRETKIEILNLEGNKLGDTAIALILNALENNKTLSVLNISKNFLSDKSAERLASILKDGYCLKELYLHWNQIKAPGGNALFKSLEDNETLKVFDISCNSLGSGGSCEEQICSFLTKNIELRHLDLSSNYFRSDSSQKIAEALNKNKTIYGFHYSGNSGYVDSRGFLIVDEEKGDDLTGIHVKKRIDGCKAINVNFARNIRDEDLQDCCWICEGWSEHTLTWEQDKSGEGNPDPLFIHFNFENYRENYFGKSSGQISNYKRMFPPGHLFYFYTLDDTQNYDHSNQENIISNPEGLKISDVRQYDGKMLEVELEFVNKMDIKKNENVLDENYQPTISILPRTPDPSYIPAKKKKQRVKWTFPISIFAKWRPDDEEIYKKCFEVDWDNCKIPQKIKKQEDQDQVKEFLRSKYKHIKDTYKYFASQAPIQDIWCIQNGPWLELIQLMNILDAKVKDADINLKWTATISGGDKGNQRNPERGISRHQLMEALVRIAEEKYILKYGKTTSFYEATKMFWEEHLESLFVERYNQQKWRSELYWVEDVDYCLKNYKKIIEHIYKKFAKQKVKPGQVPFMCLDELNKIVQIAGLMEDEHFGSGVVNFAFNLAMMTQIDELQSDRIFQMSILEFYEALTRIAEGAALPVGPGMVEAEFEWTWEKRVAQPLAHKLEGLIIKLFNTVCDASFRAAYPKVEKSFFVKVDDSDEFE